MAAAREAVRDGADVLVAQGIDAGGHQFVAGAGIVSLVPEVKAMLVEEKLPQDREVVVVAAGGIAHGSAVVGAIALGECFTDTMNYSLVFFIDPSSLRSI